jgi:hypothetical protein
MDVVVRNLTGHKLPTAYPSRRAWLDVVVRDRAGRAVFESGALRSDGSIIGNDNDADPLRFEPHHREIRSADEVEIYESIMHDRDGRVTTGLLQAIGYAKDNRLLPLGFDKGAAVPDIAVRGDASGDPDFAAGGDRVRYSVDVSRAEGPFSVEATLRYQPIAFRWAHNLSAHSTPEATRFVSWYEEMAGASSAVLARDSASVR